MKTPSVFLSHSSKDKPLARRIAEDLRRQEIEVWLDEWEVLVGDSITQSIQHGLEGTDFVAVLLTANSLASGWVEKEWSSKVSHEASTRDVVILPLKADNQPLPPLLRDKKYADFSINYDKGIRDLVSAVNGHVLRKKDEVRGFNDLQPKPPFVSGEDSAVSQSQANGKQWARIAVTSIMLAVGLYFLAGIMAGLTQLATGSIDAAAVVQVLMWLLGFFVFGYYIIRQLR